LQTVVKKWFKDKEYGFLDNGSGPDIMVRKSDLVRCQFLKAGTTVEFECHPAKGALIAKNVRLIRQNSGGKGANGNHNKGDRSRFIGVMT
jgi:cold shock CspA family protein